MHGFLFVDKPDGPTSHDIVSRVRRITGEKRVGHAGTLDPFATGLLIVGVGRVATREFPKLVGLDKTYEAVFALGAASDTDDRTGTIGVRVPVTASRGQIDAELKRLTGPIEQIPPSYSAIKVGGKKMYELARAGKEVERKPRPVTIYALDVLDDSLLADPLPRIRVRISCSTGTYIRSIARDLGAALGVGGYVEELRRTSVGPFCIEEATLLSDLSKLSDPSRIPLIPIESVLSRVGHSATVTP